MKFTDWLKVHANMSKKQPALGIILIVFIGLLVISHPLLSPGGLGLNKEISVITKIQEDLSENSSKETITTEDSGKTVWDWLSLLGVPLSLALLGPWIQASQQKQAKSAAIKQQEQAETERKEEVLQVYFDRISVLLMDSLLLEITDKETLSPKQQKILDTTVDVVRARTLSILRRFSNDGERKASVLRFLIETKSISQLYLSLNGAELNGAELNGVKLNGVKLNGAKLNGAKLNGAKLNGAKLNGAKLNGAELNEAELNEAELNGAKLSGAKLRNAKLRDVKLKNALLRGAGLREADLRGAQLTNTVFNGADLKDIKFDDSTSWPAKEMMDKARNIPEKLKQQLEL